MDVLKDDVVLKTKVRKAREKDRFYWASRLRLLRLRSAHREDPYRLCLLRLTSATLSTGRSAHFDKLNAAHREDPSAPLTSTYFDCAQHKYFDCTQYISDRFNAAHRENPCRLRFSALSTGRSAQVLRLHSVHFGQVQRSASRETISIPVSLLFRGNC